MTERLVIPGVDGGTLAARLPTPPGELRAYALARGVTCGRDIEAEAADGDGKG